MFHMITDNIEAYRRAVVSTVEALQTLIERGDSKELNNCREEERIRYDGLVSVIIMEIKAAAADEPHNPFSINEDVNQPETNTFICDNGMMSPEPDHSQPPPPRKEK